MEQIQGNEMKAKEQQKTSLFKNASSELDLPSMKAYISSIKKANSLNNGESNFINPKNYQVNLNMRSLRPLERERVVNDQKLHLEFITTAGEDEPDPIQPPKTLTINSLSDSSKSFLQRLRGKNHSTIAHQAAVSTLQSLSSQFPV